MIGLPRAAERRLAISLVIALVALIPTGSVQAREGGQIVFQSRIDDNTDIYVMDGDGTNVRRLTDAPEGDGSPRWSPGGTRIVFVSDRDGTRQVYTMVPDGGSVRRVTDAPTSVSAPVWSPDGQEIAFFANYQESGIHIMDRDGGNVRFLTGPPDPKGHPGNHFQDSYGGLDWSPDGQTLLFNAHSGGEAACVWAIDVDGRNPRKLTGDEGHDFGQAWSADGREILFHQSDRIPGFYTMGPNGRNRTELLVPFKAGIARWSPSEEEIIFVMDGDIHIGRIAEQNVRRLVELPGRERSPDWFDPAHARAVSAESRTPVIWGQLKGSEARPAE